MTREDQFISQLEAYLDEYEGMTPLPDAVRSAVRADLPRTKQARPLGGPMRYLNRAMQLPTSARFGLAAAVLVTLIALGAALGGFRNVATDTAPTPTARPSGTDLPTAESAPLHPGLIEPGEADGVELTAGRYVLDEPFPVQLAFEVSEGWAAGFYTGQASQINLQFAETPGELSFEIVDNVTADPCTDDLLDPPVGPSVDDLVSALSSLDRFEATPAMDVTVDGFRGKQFTLTAPAHPGCDLRTWATTTRQNGVGPREINEIQVIDVNGVRLLICVAYEGRMSASQRAEFQAVLDSLQISR